MRIDHLKHQTIKVSTLLVIILWSTFSIAKVEITISDKTYTYNQNPRLADVLMPVHLEQEWYWAAAAIFDLKSNSTASIRTAAVAELAQFAHSDKTNKIDYQILIDQIKSWQLATRVVSEIDYEIARIRLDKNPLFEDGKYLISLSTRPKYIHVNGATTKQINLSYEENSCIEHYLNQITVLDVASDDYVYVIQPNGNIRTVGIAYWNKQCTMIMPGSQIYVPIKESILFSDTAKLNNTVASLLSNRILAQ